MRIEQMLNSPGRSWCWFSAWAGVGLISAFTLLAAFTFGIFALLVGLTTAVVVASRPGNERGVPGLLTGWGLALSLVAIAPGLALVAGGFLVFVVVERRKP